MKISPTPVLDLKLIHPASPFSQTSRRLAAQSPAMRLAALGLRLTAPALPPAIQPIPTPTKGRA